MVFLDGFKSIAKAVLLTTVAFWTVMTSSQSIAEAVVDSEELKFYNQSVPGLISFGTYQTVKASPQTIWSILADNEKYPEWNPFTPEAKTTFEVGSPIEFKVRLFRELPKLLYPQKETIARFDVNDTMCWQSSIINDVFFKSFRCINLQIIPNGHTRVTNSMFYTGLSAGVMFLFTSGSVNNGFEDLSKALKARAEAFEAE